MRHDAQAILTVTALTFFSLSTFSGCQKSGEARESRALISKAELAETFGRADVQTESKLQKNTSLFRYENHGLYQTENGKVVAQFSTPSNSDEETLQFWRHRFRGQIVQFFPLPSSAGAPAEFQLVSQAAGIAVIYRPAEDLVTQVVSFQGGTYNSVNTKAPQLGSCEYAADLKAHRILRGCSSERRPASASPAQTTPELTLQQRQSVEKVAVLRLATCLKVLRTVTADENGELKLKPFTGGARFIERPLLNCVNEHLGKDIRQVVPDAPAEQAVPVYLKILDAELEKLSHKEDQARAERREGVIDVLVGEITSEESWRPNGKIEPSACQSFAEAGFDLYFTKVTDPSLTLGSYLTPVEDVRRDWSRDACKLAIRVLSRVPASAPTSAQR